MSDSYDATIEELKGDILERMRTVNALLKLKGQPPLYPDPESIGAATPHRIRTDQWYGAALSTAAREYLEMQRAAGGGPASADDIYDAMVKGGFKFDAKDEVNAKAALRQSLTKNTAIFHRLPNGHYGLSVWYPRKATAEERQVAQVRKRGQARKSAAQPLTDKKGKAVTLLAAVRAAVQSRSGTFTKQDILDWIVENHPGLQAGDRKASVYTMVAKLKDELGIVAEPGEKGNTPHVFRVAKNGDQQ